MASGTNIGKGYLQIVPSSEGIQGAVTKMLRGEAESAGSSAGSTIGSKIVTAIKAAGIGTAIKVAVGTGADIEQSWGGIQTMFKSSAGQMAKYAKDAYKNAGVSANAYMENVTSFSASLIQGLNGNTKKAAKAANTAMIDMSDNANKFGTDIGSIQNAYQGFAKQNYTMLDNLKLGYGGTASEMARLINDSGVMGKKFKATSKNMNEVPFDKVIEAIHKTQEEMGVTGTTSKEASETISGSYGMMKASVTDFLGALTMSGSDGMSDFKMNVYDTFMNLVTSAFTFGKNFGAAVSRLFDNVATLISSKGPDMAKQGMEFLANVSKGFIDGIPNFVSHVLDLFEAFADNMAANMPEILLMGKEMLSNVITGLTNAIPELVARVPTIINKFAGLINDYAPTLIVYGFELIKQLGQGIIQAVPVIIANLPQIFTAIMNVWSAFDWINMGRTAIKLIGNGITVIGAELPNVIRNVGNMAKESFKNVNWSAAGKSAIGLLKKAVTSAGNAIITALKSVGKKATTAFKSLSWASVGKAAMNLLKTAITGAGGLLVSALKAAGTKALNAFKGINWKSLGTNIVNGIKKGITGAASGLYNSLKNLASNALKSAKKFLGIHSPSRVFADQVGSMIPSGIALGISANTSSLLDEINAMSDKAVVAATGTVNFDASRLQRDNYTNATASDDRGADFTLIATLLEMILNSMDNMQVVLDDGTLVGRVEKDLIRGENRRRLAWK